MAGASVSTTPSRFWFLRKDSGAEYGPVAESVLADWARAGRVAPEDFVSADRVAWIASPDLAALDMVWMLELEDGASYGPAHRGAFESMLAEGALSPPIRLRNVKTGETVTIGAGAEAAPAAPSAAEAAPPAHKGDTQRLAAAAAPSPPPAERAEAEAGTANAKTATPTAAEPPPARDAALSPPPAPALKPAGDPAAKTAAEPPPPPPAASESTQIWPAIARERDRFEREAARWKTMYEQAAAAGEMLSRRVEDLTAALERDRLAADAERDDLRRRVAELENALDRAVQRAGAVDARLVESYHELVRNYEILTAQFEAKNDDLRRAQEEAAALRRERDAHVQMLEEQARRDRTAAEEVQRRLAEIEHAHLELLKSYRDMNDRFIRMRDAAGPSDPTDGASAGGRDGEESSGPRVRLWR